MFELIRRYEGFIVHAAYQITQYGTRIFFTGRLRTGETFAVVEDRTMPGLFVRESDRERTAGDPPFNTGVAVGTDLHTADGEAVFRMEWPQIAQQQDAAGRLASRNIRTYEADIRFYDQYMIDRHLFGSVTIEGNATTGRRVDLVFHNPVLEPSSWIPLLSVLSVDIETNPDTGEILSVAVATDDTWRKESEKQVLFLGEGEVGEETTCFRDEKSMLEDFRNLVVELDPDIMTGWNVIEFDFSILFERFKRYGIPFTLGRSDEPGNFLPGAKGQSSAVIVPGRQVIDGMRVVRNGPMRFDDNRLETVAREVLGKGKVAFTAEENLTGRRKIDALLETYRNDPATFCRYNLRDAVLVLDILEQTGLMDLTIRRAALTGVGLARAWTSVASFEHLYISSMRNRGFVAPTHGVDAYEISTAPGGAIIPPQPGLYNNVLLYDFKSLYPSIMRTFNIDPVSYVSSTSNLRRDEIGDLIQAPNNALFRREPAILPEILDNFTAQRETAKRNKDQVASYVYKIIMNSFYGVLGTPGCRFASSDIAGAITSFGHHILNWCKDNLEAHGHRVIYGDTDSLFVVLNPSTEKADAPSIAADLNYALGRYIKQKWRVESKLELEYECLYLRFFLPAVRGPSAGSVGEGEETRPKGRAKGYAGMRVNPGSPDTPVFEIKGMEAVRRDWTSAARNLQRELLSMVFRDSSVEDLRNYIRSYVGEIMSGKHDDDLVYRKALRKPVSAYTRSTPPHVQAAKELDAADQQGVIEYLWTNSGPQPVVKLSSPIDYDHYLQKQLKPIAEGIAIILNTDLTTLFTNTLQTDLF